METQAPLEGPVINAYYKVLLALTNLVDVLT